MYLLHIYFIYFLVHHKTSLIWKKSKVCFFYQVVKIYTFHSISFLFNARRKRRDKIIPKNIRKYMNILYTTVVELQLSEESRIVFSSYPKILISCVIMRSSQNYHKMYAHASVNFHPFFLSEEREKYDSRTFFDTVDVILNFPKFTFS